MSNALLAKFTALKVENVFNSFANL